MQPIKTYKQATEYIFSMSTPKDQKFKPGFHLDRIRDFLAFVGNPQDSYPTIHIGGTAGKGSTSLITASILSSLGYKVGLHTSPFLVSINEKFQIINPHNHEEKGRIINCSNEEFVFLVNWYIENSVKFEKLRNDGIKLTFYEAIIAMVFKYFEKQKVDIAVIEVALGGRFDATNVINSEVAVLNSVGFDHMHILGNTLEEITYDKMHIMKTGKPFISGLRDENLNRMVIDHATKLNANLEIIAKDFNYEIVKSGIERTTFNFSNSNISIENCELSLIGDFQAHNASLAIEAIYQLINTNLKFSKSIEFFEDAVKNTLQKLNYKARFDIIQKEPYIILDGAHNELKMRRLVDNLLNYFPDKEFEILFSCTNTKDLKGILDELFRLNIKKIYLSEFSKKYYEEISSFSINEIKTLIESYKRDIEIIESPNSFEAFTKFKLNLNPNSVGLVTGSLYLLGGIYENLA